MPVPATEPHPMTVRHEGHKPTCYDMPRIRKPHYGETRVYAEDGTWHREPEEIDTEWLNPECQIAKDPLPECAGCKHIKEKE